MLRLRKSSHIKITFREEAIVPGEATATTALTDIFPGQIADTLCRTVLADSEQCQSAVFDVLGYPDEIFNVVDGHSRREYVFPSSAKRHIEMRCRFTK